MAECYGQEAMSEPSNVINAFGGLGMSLLNLNLLYAISCFICKVDHSYCLKQFPEGVWQPPCDSHGVGFGSVPFTDSLKASGFLLNLRSTPLHPDTSRNLSFGATAISSRTVMSVPPSILYSALRVLQRNHF